MLNIINSDNTCIRCNPCFNPVCRIWKSACLSSGFNLYSTQKHISYRNRFKDISYPELCDIIAENINQLCVFGYTKDPSMTASNIKLIYNDKFTHHTRKYYFGKLEYDKKEMIKNNYKK